MKTIIYKKRLGRYECVKITDNGGKDFKIVFDEPIDGKLSAGKGVFDVRSGVSTGLIASLGEGEIVPKLYSERKQLPLEPFTVSCGAVLPSRVNDEYARHLGEHYEILKVRIDTLEKALKDIYEKINQPLNF